VWRQRGGDRDVDELSDQPRRPAKLTMRLLSCGRLSRDLFWTRFHQHALVVPSMPALMVAACVISSKACNSPQPRKLGFMWRVVRKARGGRARARTVDEAETRVEHPVLDQLQGAAKSAAVSPGSRR